MTTWIRQFPVTTFFILAFTFTWALLPFAHLSVAVGILSLLGPAAAALITAFICGSETLQDFKHRLFLWKVQVRWYLLAVLLPFLVSALRSGFELLLGASGPIQLQPIGALELIVFAMVFGEEAGWRGFASPRLQAAYGPWVSSVIIGVLWALWHLPLFYMSGMPQYQHPFVPYIGYLIALSILLGWLTQRAMGSVVIATVFHGAVNTFGIINADASSDIRGWTNFACYALVAVVVRILASNRQADL